MKPRSISDVEKSISVIEFDFDENMLTAFGSSNEKLFDSKVSMSSPVGHILKSIRRSVANEISEKEWDQWV